MTSGGSAMQAITAVRSHGASVAAVLSVVDREEGGTERLSRWPFIALFRKQDIFGEIASERSGA